MGKVSIIGSGRVGATTALGLARKGLAEVVIVDVVEGLPQGTALDMMQSAVVEPCHGGEIKGSNDYADIVGSDVVIVTAGFPRSPGMSREDLLVKNAPVVKSIVQQIVNHSPEAKVLVVTNPLDTMTYLAFKVSGWSRKRVFGMGGALDTARMCYFITDELKVPLGEVTALVLGDHGESMVPLPRFCTVGGKSLVEIASLEVVDRIVERTRQGGAEIVGFLKGGSAFYAPAACIVQMVETILTDQKEVIPASVYARGEYGLEGVCLGLPGRLGRNGLEQVIELDLTEEERKALHHSAQQVKASLKKITSFI